MIQRIQTVWWIVSVAILSAVIFLPLFRHEQGDYLTTNSIGLSAAIIFTVALTGVNIFLYKNRKLQIKTGYGLIFLHLLICFLIGANYHLAKAIQFFPWAALPLASLVLQILAIRAVKKDEELVRSMNRLR